MSGVEDIFLAQVLLLGLHVPEREYRFDKKRRWRFDFAWVDKKIAVEIEGGTWKMGRHVRASGFENDCRKYNAAVCDGWSLYRFTTAMVMSGEAANFIEHVLRDLAAQANCVLRRET